MLSYVHPFLAVLVLALLAHVASLGVKARNDRRRRNVHLERHARRARWMFVAMLLIWVGGLASTWTLRPAAELATSTHFRMSLGLLAVLTASAVTSRWMHVEMVRSVHPWIGVLAILVAAAHFFYGLEILP